MDTRNSPMQRSGEPPLEWDKNLDTLKISLVPANAPVGAPYWRLIRAVYDASARGRSAVFCEVQNEKGERLLGQKLTLTWPGGSGQATTENKPVPEFAANFPIGGSYNSDQGPGPYTVSVEGLPSDRVSGLGRPKGRDAYFYLTWRRSTFGPAVAQSAIRGIVIGGQAGQVVILRPASGQPQQTTLDGAGAFVFTNLAAGTYTVEVGGISVPNLRVDGSSTLNVPLIDLRPRQSIIKGTVLKASGDPAAAAKLTLSSTETRQETTTDAKGKYQFQGLLEGDYIVEVAGQTQKVHLNGRDQATVDFRLPAEAGRKLIAQYLLFGPPQQIGTRTNLVLAEDYILKSMPTVGFSVDEALQAATVIIVGDIQAVSAADEERLKANGCQVTRLGGGPYAIEQAFAELAKSKGVSPVPSERLRAPTRNGPGSENSDSA